MNFDDKHVPQEHPDNQSLVEQFYVLSLCRNLDLQEAEYFDYVVVQTEKILEEFKAAKALYAKSLSLQHSRKDPGP